MTSPFAVLEFFGNWLNSDKWRYIIILLAGKTCLYIWSYYAALRYIIMSLKVLNPREMTFCCDKNDTVVLFHVVYCCIYCANLKIYTMTQNLRKAVHFENTNRPTVLWVRKYHIDCTRAELHGGLTAGLHAGMHAGLHLKATYQCNWCILSATVLLWKNENIIVYSETVGNPTLASNPYRVTPCLRQYVKGPPGRFHTRLGRSWWLDNIQLDVFCHMLPLPCRHQ